MTLVIALVGVLISATTAITAYRLSLARARADSYALISDLHEKIVRLRLEHPEVMALARRWSDACFRFVYSDTANVESSDWIVYYSYGELCNQYCNAVLYAADRKLMRHDDLEAQYLPLVRLALVENYPFVRSCMVGEYISARIRRFVDAERSRGWDWDHRFSMLPESGDPPAS